MKARKAANLRVVADNTPRMTEDGGLPKLPSYLPEEVSGDWDVAVQSLHERGMLTNDILPTVESYVIAIWDQRDAMRKIQEDGRTYKLKGDIKKNPAVSDMKIAREEMLRLATALCLTPAEKIRQGGGSVTPPSDDGGPDDGAPPGLVI